MDATPLRRRRSPALRFGQASDGGSEGMALPDPVIDFAELDAHNFFSAVSQPNRFAKVRNSGVTICRRRIHVRLQFTCGCDTSR
jgi:hypothetical protein